MVKEEYQTEDVRKIKLKDFIPIKGFFDYAIRNLKHYTDPPYRQLVSLTALSIYNILIIEGSFNGLEKLVENIQTSGII